MRFEKLYNKIKLFVSRKWFKHDLSMGKRPYELYQYVNSDGGFDYEQYKKIQIEANKTKIKCVWAKEKNILFLSNFIKSKNIKPQFGICHGTRRGVEQGWFSKYLECKVVGTEISDTAQEFANTIQWDFHDVKEEWVSNVDFIYSNSLDHSYDPQKCLNSWISCLSKNGLLIIEHSEDDQNARITDPFGVSILVLPYLILSWSHGAYCVTEILEAPSFASIGEKEYKTFFLIIKRNE